MLPPLRELMTDAAECVCLIKPQFEAGRKKVGKKGVVREKSTHIEVIENVLQFTLGFGFEVLGLDFSPIKGPEGNIEYLMYIKKGENPASKEDDDSQSDESDGRGDESEKSTIELSEDMKKEIRELVEKSHEVL